MRCTCTHFGQGLAGSRGTTIHFLKIDVEGGDEHKIVKAVAEALGLQAVYSRRLELARQKIPETFAAIPTIGKAVAQDLANRAYDLVQTRAARHRKMFGPGSIRKLSGGCSRVQCPGALR